MCSSDLGRAKFHPIATLDRPLGEPLSKKPPCELFAHTAPSQLPEQRPIAALPRAVTRCEQRTRESLVVEEPDLFESLYGRAHVLFGIPQREETLGQRLAGLWRTTQ